MALYEFRHSLTSEGQLRMTHPLKIAPPRYDELRERILQKLGPNRCPLLIGIDGQNGAAKTSLSNWLAWQLGMPALHLDLFMCFNEECGTFSGWRVEYLSCAIMQRLGCGMPIIVEGCKLLDALQAVSQTVDFHVYVRRPATTNMNKSAMVSEYVRRKCSVLRHPDFTLLGYVDSNGYQS